MPTNPLWIEHTERAAWDTVQTLRSELERERKHVERLTRLRPTWEKLLALLDGAKDFALDAEEPAELVAELGSRARDLERERDTLKADLERRAREQVFVQPMVAAPLDSSPRAPVKKSSVVRWFARLIEERRALRAPGKKSDPARLIRALELKVDDLAQARSSELLELAVEIGVLALELARAARRSPKPRH